MWLASYMCAGDPNSGPHACMRSTLSTEPFSSPLLIHSGHIIIYFDVILCDVSSFRFGDLTEDLRSTTELSSSTWDVPLQAYIVQCWNQGLLASLNIYHFFVVKIFKTLSSSTLEIYSIWSLSLVILLCNKIPGFLLAKCNLTSIDDILSF